MVPFTSLYFRIDIFMFILSGKKRQTKRKKSRKQPTQTSHRTLCLPFYSLLLAMGNPIVDYFSLDVEGAEQRILETIPWDKVNIKVFDINAIKSG